MGWYLLFVAACSLNGTCAKNLAVQGHVPLDTFLGVQYHGDANKSAAHLPLEKESRSSASALLANPALAPYPRPSWLPPTPPGFLLGIFVAVVVLAAFAIYGLWLWLTSGLQAEGLAEEPAGPKEFDLAKWKEDARTGHLEVYTCVGLNLGRSKASAMERLVGASRYFTRLVVLFGMQVILGVLLIVYFMQQGVYFPEKQGNVFRVIGAMLFGYSSYQLYHSMRDLCRDRLLDVMNSRLLSPWYVWPILFGELMNTIAVCLLLVILFLIFCTCHQPEALLINCLAINFVADIDNRLINEDDIQEALKNIDMFQEYILRVSHRTLRFDMESGSFVLVRTTVEKDTVARPQTTPSPLPPSPSPGCGTPPSPSPDEGGIVHTEKSRDLTRLVGFRERAAPWRHVAANGFLLFDGLCRALVPIFAAALLFFFAFAHNDAVCQRMREIEPWPFCIGHEG